VTWAYQVAKSLKGIDRPDDDPKPGLHAEIFPPDPVPCKGAACPVRPRHSQLGSLGG
jgi:hypothetical protein